MKTEDQRLNILSIHAPEDSKPEAERESSFEQLQNTIDSLPRDQPMITLGDFNARIEVRTLNSANVVSDHSLLLGKLRITFMLQKNTKLAVKTRKINVESLRDPTIEELYGSRPSRCHIGFLEVSTTTGYKKSPEGIRESRRRKQ
ncbi:hypothetical protein WA026_019920 [Henosepilachna vigintioctopunctata]|uniref:Endonuclease/exonuclease/phosphatase domain-containing protein n=1 Tax=Henosepilachna vigintioctopunctata TaxID=420089 RepID=A0AAW1V1U0_9CUCU